MPQWLYSEVLAHATDWNPVFALPSMLNWPRALAQEIIRQHGADTLSQATSCTSKFAGSVRLLGSPPSNGRLFSPLFHSMTFTNSLQSLNESGAVSPWVYSSAVITWYYAVYHAFRSVIIAWNGSCPNQHEGTIRAFDGVRDKLPHPLNMRATRSRGENYDAELPDFPGVPHHDLERTFDTTPSTTRGMLLQYINGTAKWKTDLVKEKIMAEDTTITNFRSNRAKELRDHRLPQTINFMNCAYRYRTKMNYRDGMLFAYGGTDSRFDGSFIPALTDSARFAWICAISFLRSRIGPAPVSSFLSDLDSNFREGGTASANILFWRALRGLLY